MTIYSADPQREPVYVRGNMIMINPEVMERGKSYEFTFKGKRMRTTKMPDGIIKIYEDINGS